MSAESRKQILEKRAFFLQTARKFFEQRNILEVDVCALNPTAPIDQHIEVMQVEQEGYLHTSPEYGIKCLLSEIKKDLYQISHVFRKKEKGPLHHPEFTMIEWYRIGKEYFSFIDEVVHFCSLFTGPKKKAFVSYHEAFKIHAQMDIDKATPSDFMQCLKKHGVHFAKNINLQDLVLTEIIEPHLGKDCFTILYDYPKEQQALAKTYVRKGREVSKRFEIYYQGIELANGYDELTDKNILQEILEKESIYYAKNFQKKLHVDPYLLQAMENFPDCCGVAVGFDRLLMLHLQENCIQKVMPFPSPYFSSTGEKRPFYK